MMPVLTRPRAPQVTQDNRVLLDLLVPLVHAVVLVGVLPSLVLEVKKLADLPHIMEMNQWISKCNRENTALLWQQPGQVGDF